LICGKHFTDKKEIQKMLDQTSNHPSASEVVFETANVAATGTNGTLAVYQDDLFSKK